MAHVPKTPLHAYTGQTFLVRAQPIAGLTASGTNTPVLRIDGMANVNGTKEDTDDGLVIEASFTVDAETTPGTYRWQLWIADSDSENPRPVAVGDLHIERKVPA